MRRSGLRRPTRVVRCRIHGARLQHPRPTRQRVGGSPTNYRRGQSQSRGRVLRGGPCRVKSTFRRLWKSQTQRMPLSPPTPKSSPKDNMNNKKSRHLSGAIAQGDAARAPTPTETRGAASIQVAAASAALAAAEARNARGGPDYTDRAGAEKLK